MEGRSSGAHGGDAGQLVDGVGRRRSVVIVFIFTVGSHRERGVPVDAEAPSSSRQRPQIHRGVGGQHQIVDEDASIHSFTQR